MSVSLIGSSGGCGPAAGAAGGLAGQQAADLGEQRSVRGAPPGIALEQPRPARS
jgi:hypothetical protein